MAEYRKYCYILPYTKDFEEKESVNLTGAVYSDAVFQRNLPPVCWERPYGWLLGYSVLFDPVLQAGMKEVPEFSNGVPEKIEPDVFYMTSGGEATEEFHPENVPGLFLCPDNGKPERISMKERLKTPCGQFFLPPDFPYTDADGNDPEWRLGERSVLFRKNDHLELYFELFFMINYMGFEYPEKHLLIASDLLAEMLPGSLLEKHTEYSRDFRLDCQSYGMSRMFLQWILRLIHEDPEQVRKADEYYLESVRIYQTGNIPAAENSLKKSFCELYRIRTEYIPLDLKIAEYPHAGIIFPESGFFELEWPEGSRNDINIHLDRAEQLGSQTSLELSAGDWYHLNRMYPGMISRIGKLWNSGKIELTNGTQSLPYAFISPLGLQYFQFRNGQETFRSVFGKVPDLYECQENSFTPQMPELLAHFGYKGVLHFSMNHGCPEFESEPQITWTSPSGTGLQALTGSSDDQVRQGYNFFLALPLCLLKYKDKTSFNIFNLMDIGYCPFRDNMIRTARFAPVFGRFILGSAMFDRETAGPRKTYSADNYHFSPDAFYRNYTNKNALSHFEHLFHLISEFRTLQLLGNQNLCTENDMINQLCLLEAHDCDRVQGQRPGEFYYRKTNETSPYSRKELSESLGKIRAGLQKTFDTMYAQTVPQKSGKVFNPADVPLSFAELRHTEKYEGIPFNFCGRNYLSGTFPALSFSEQPDSPGQIEPSVSMTEGVLGNWSVSVENNQVIVKRGNQCSAFFPVDYSHGPFHCDSSVYRMYDNWLTIQLKFTRDTPAPEIMILEGITSKDSDYIEWNIRYSGRNHFAEDKRWEDFLGLSFAIEPDAKIQNYVPAMMSETKESRIMSSYCLNAGNSYSLLFEGVGNFFRKQDQLFWLLHVANETEWQRKIVISFRNDCPALLSRGFFSGLYPAAEQIFHFPEEFTGKISVECQISGNQWLISNVTDRKIEIPVSSDYSVRPMRNSSMDGNVLGPWQIGILEIFKTCSR